MMQQKTQEKALQSTNSNYVALSYTGTCQVKLWEDLAMSRSEDRVLVVSGDDWELTAGVQVKTLVLIESRCAVPTTSQLVTGEEGSEVSLHV